MPSETRGPFSCPPGEVNPPRAAGRTRTHPPPRRRPTPRPPLVHRPRLALPLQRPPPRQNRPPRVLRLLGPGHHRRAQKPRTADPAHTRRTRHLARRAAAPRTSLIDIHKPALPVHGGPPSAG